MSGTGSEEWDRLNAYVDGELPPHEQIKMRERARRDPLVGLQIAGLRQLKREVRAAGRPQRSHRWIAAAAAGGAAIGLSLFAGFGGSLFPDTVGESRTVVGRLAEIATLSPSGRPPPDGVASVPDLWPAGFKLASVLTGTAGRDEVGLVYLGPRGCRLGLAVLGPHMLRNVDAGDSLSTRAWTAAERGFVLVAPGMDADRFARLATAVERITHGKDDPAISVAFQDTATGKPCVG